MAKRFDLDPTTIVRTVQALGYKRDGDLAADKRSVTKHIEHTLEMDIQNLNALRSQLDGEHVLENCQAH